MLFVIIIIRIIFGLYFSKDNNEKREIKGENVANQVSSQIHQTFVTKQMWEKKLGGCYI